MSPPVFLSFSVLGDSQECLSTGLVDEVKVGDDSDETEPSQPSFKQPPARSQAFQAAPDTQGPEFFGTLFEFSPTK